MAAGRDWETKQFPGGIRNDIHKIVMRTGVSTARYQDKETGQSTGPHLLRSRVTDVSPDSRALNPYTKDADV